MPSQPVSRRRALQLAAAGLAASAAGGLGLWKGLGDSTPSARPGDSHAPFGEPTPLPSASGQLSLSLRAQETATSIAGAPATVWSYNGSLPGPTIRVRGGDRLSITLENGLSAPTNLHVHGLYVSPAGNSDNVLITVAAGESFDYVYDIPADHPPGVYWYHPHHHGMVADQLFAGLYGAIIVEDPASAPAPIEATRERVMVISDISLDSSGRVRAPTMMERAQGREGDLVLLNGQLSPELSAVAGQRERWRIVNACSSRYLRLRLVGQQVQLLGIDSGRYSSPKAIDELVLTPGNRADLLVTVTPGGAALRTLPYDRGSAGMRGGATTAAVTLATLRVTDGTTAPLAPVPSQPTERDLRGAAAISRTLILAMGAGGGGMGSGGMRFTIDGKEFNPDRIDRSATIGSVEEWTIVNTSAMDHPFHLHVWAMQLVRAGGQPVDSPVWQDVHNVPAQSQITVRIAFDRFPGRTVYHCHILDHEDLGMMGIINVS